MFQNETRTGNLKSIFETNLVALNHYNVERLNPSIMYLWQTKKVKALFHTARKKLT